MSDITSGPLGGLDPEARGRIRTLAFAVMERILEHYGYKRASGGNRVELKFSAAAPLYRVAPDDGSLAALLNELLPEQTGLRFSAADATIHFPWDGYVALALHPADMDVSNLTEVPDEVRVFKFNTVAPYDIAEAPVLKPDRIVAAREHRDSPLTPLNNAWEGQYLSLARRLLTRVTAEYERQAGTLPEPVATVVSGLLAQGRANPKVYLVKVLQAAAFLDILPEVTAGFGDEE